MRQITISVTFEKDDSADFLRQLEEYEYRYASPYLRVTNVYYDKEWEPGITKITFIGDES